MTSDPTDARARQLLESHRRDVYRRTNYMFVVLMLLQWIGCIVVAVLITPRTWTGADSSVHVHVWLAALLGMLLSAYPIYLLLRYPQRALTRHVVAASQMLWSALLIHVTGGRIETHFHVFGSLAFLAVYRDWKILVTATVVVTADHAIRGVFAPESVFGVLYASPWRTVEHAWWVIFENIFLFVAIRYSVQEMWGIAQRQARLEGANERIESKVQARTAELKAQTIELEKAREAAETATRTKSEFLANMSHEIRTPLSAILGFTEVLLAPDSIEDEQANACRTIHRNGRHLLTLINDILDLSKVEASKLEIESTLCATRRLLLDVSSLLCGRAEEKSLLLQIEIDGEIPEFIRTDSTRLKQALVNLVGNAIKFTPRGRVRIVASCDRANEKISFRVIDEGIGIKPEHVDHIFAPFVQGDSSTSRRFGGTGLGLPITRRIAKLLGGDVAVESRVNVGSTFTLTVSTGPLAGIQLVTASDPIPKPLDDLCFAPDALPRIERRILLAEDGEDNQRLICMFLHKAGATVDVVEDGAAAVREAMNAVQAGRPYDLILMDIQMPELDGHQAVRELRERGYEGNIIALTAHAMVGEREKCMAIGFDHYLSKPISREVLVRETARWAAKTSRTPRRTPAAATAGRSE